MAAVTHFGLNVIDSRAPARLRPGARLVAWARGRLESLGAPRRRRAEREIGRVLERSCRFTDAQEREIVARLIAQDWGEPRRPNSIQDWGAP